MVNDFLTKLILRSQGNLSGLRPDRAISFGPDSLFADSTRPWVAEPTTQLPASPDQTVPPAVTPTPTALAQAQPVQPRMFPLTTDQSTTSPSTDSQIQRVQPIIQSDSEASSLPSTTSEASAGSEVSTGLEISTISEVSTGSETSTDSETTAYYGEAPPPSQSLLPVTDSYPLTPSITSPEPADLPNATAQETATEQGTLPQALGPDLERAKPALRSHYASTPSRPRETTSETAFETLLQTAPETSLNAPHSPDLTQDFPEPSNAITNSASQLNNNSTALPSPSLLSQRPQEPVPNTQSSVQPAVKTAAVQPTVKPATVQPTVQPSTGQPSMVTQLRSAELSTPQSFISTTQPASSVQLHTSTVPGPTPQVPTDEPLTSHPPTPHLPTPHLPTTEPFTSPSPTTQELSVQASLRPRLEAHSSPPPPRDNLTQATTTAPSLFSPVSQQSPTTSTLKAQTHQTKRSLRTERLVDQAQPSIAESSLITKNSSTNTSKTVSSKPNNTASNNVATPYTQPLSPPHPKAAPNLTVLSQGLPLAESASLASAFPHRNAETSPTIEITIGQIEVRAASPTKAPPQSRAKSRSRSPNLSLEQYLKRRNQG